MTEFILSLFTVVRVFIRSRSDTALEVLGLRQQVAVLKRKRPRPALNRGDRLFWTLLRSGFKTATVIFIDLDGLKKLNDRAGITAGDRCLMAIAQAILEVLEEKPVVHRVMGDQIAVIVIDLESGYANDLAEFTRIAIERAGAPFGVTGSLGTAILTNLQGPHPLNAAEVLASAARRACRVAKESGKNCVHSLAPDSHMTGLLDELEKTLDLS